jgi:hypothetical protein
VADAKEKIGIHILWQLGIFCGHFWYIVGRKIWQPYLLGLLRLEASRLQQLNPFFCLGELAPSRQIVNI